MLKQMEYLFESDRFTPFKHPFTCVIAGSTGSGKTYFLTNALLHSDVTFTRPIERLVYCYGTYLTDTFEQLRTRFPRIELIDGIDSTLEFNPATNNVLVIDDLMSDAVKSSVICDYFTKGSHHKNLSVILLTQNIFQKGTCGTTININAHYTVYFKNPRNSQQIGYLARQMYRGKSNALIEAYEDCVTRPHGYIFIDYRQDTDDKLRLKTNVLPTDPPPVAVYVPK